MTDINTLSDKEYEYVVQRKLEQQTGCGHASCPAGIIDILTPETIIEIKRWETWKTAQGQLLAYQDHFPNHNMRAHFFGKMPSDEMRVSIITALAKRRIAVTWEEEKQNICGPILKKEGTERIKDEKGFVVDVTYNKKGIIVKRVVYDSSLGTTVKTYYTNGKIKTHYETCEKQKSGYHYNFDKNGEFVRTMYVNGRKRETCTSAELQKQKGDGMWERELKEYPEGKPYSVEWALHNKTIIDRILHTLNSERIHV